jgi:hypothetical protein
MAAMSGAERMRRYRARQAEMALHPTSDKVPAPPTVDLSTFDPRQILASIANDPLAPAGARVSAARTLLDVPLAEAAEPKITHLEEDSEAIDRRVTEHAIALLNRTSRMN